MESQKGGGEWFFAIFHIVDEFVLKNDLNQDIVHEYL